ncbi:MAG: DUF2911 domain-containing protein [Chitinophagaceae bacterium]|nr:DUF2911 domain-containing protein [Bacteroidota bacterium]MCC6258370.1 DUF2911 domain-containing protein [Chitinophagaceae bacterium]
MKRLAILFLVMALSATSGFGQSKPPSIDKSPLDFSYFPENYPLLKTQDRISGPPIARVIYSRPEKNNRVIFGDLVNYGKVWRLGANENTEIEFFQNVKINNTKINKGRYSLFAIPEKEKWTIILNQVTDLWGAFRYDSTKDIIRVAVPVEKTESITEPLSIFFQKMDSGFGLIIMWDNIRVSLPISL